MQYSFHFARGRISSDVSDGYTEPEGDGQNSRPHLPLDFEAMRPRRVVGETEILEHGRKEHQLAVDLRALLLRKKLAESVAAHDAVEEHVAGHRARELLDLTVDAAIGNFDL